jgi:hypothetical protein
MLKIVIALILFAHGIGHSMGLLQTFRIATVNPAWNGESWLLTGVAGPTATQAIGAVLWGAALVGFVALGAVVLGWLPESFWTPLAVAASVMSLAGLVLFPIAFPTVSSIARSWSTALSLSRSCGSAGCRATSPDPDPQRVARAGQRRATSSSTQARSRSRCSS